MRIIITSILFLIVMRLSAQDTVVTQDLRHGWLQLNEEGETGIYLEEEESKSIVFKIPQSMGESRWLSLQSAEPVDIWVNDQLLFHQMDSSLLIARDDLQPGDVVKIYADKGIPSSFKTELMTVRHEALNTPDHILSRTTSHTNDLYLILLAILLILAGVYRRYFPIAFQKSVQNPLSYKIRSISVDQNYAGFLSPDNLYSIFFFSAVAALLVQYLDFKILLISSPTFIGGLVNWLLVCLLIMLVIVLRYFWSKLIAALFEIREFPNIQTQDFVHFFTLIGLGGIIITLIDFVSTGFDTTVLSNFAIYMITLATFFFQFWVYFKFDKFYTHRKLMIFSYLCTTEFLPGLLTMYWLVKM